MRRAPAAEGHSTPKGPWVPDGDGGQQPLVVTYSGGRSMDELTLLANALMALDDKLAACMKCGVLSGRFVPCISAKRVIEGDLTRGKLALARKPWPTVSSRTRRRSTKSSIAVPPVRLLSGELPFGRENDRTFSLRRGPSWRPIRASRPSRRPHSGRCSPIRGCSASLLQLERAVPRTWPSSRTRPSAQSTHVLRTAVEAHASATATCSQAGRQSLCTARSATVNYAHGQKPHAKWPSSPAALGDKILHQRLRSLP